MSFSNTSQPFAFLTLIALMAPGASATDIEHRDFLLPESQAERAGWVPHVGPMEYPPVDVAWLLNREAMWMHVIDAPGDVPQPEQTENPSDSDEATANDNMQAVVGSLFSAMGQVSAAGSSSTPPELPDAADIQSLDHPSDLAADYGENGIASYYMTTGYGVCRAPRNTHCFYAHPLYFEDANLERCGRAHGGRTTAVSTIHFAAQILLSPFLVMHDHPDDCVQMLPDCPTCHKFPCDATCPN